MFIGGITLSLIAQSWKIPAGLDGRAMLYMAVIVLLGTVGAFTLFLQGYCSGRSRKSGTPVLHGTFDCGNLVRRLAACKFSRRRI